MAYLYLLPLAVALLAVTTVEGQAFKSGGCPKVPLQSTLNITAYLGKWYEIGKFPTWFEGDHCVTAEYSLKEDGHINVVNQYIDDDGKTHEAIGDAYVPNPEKEPAKLKVSFSKSSPKGDYWVVDTDYEGHSLVWSCSSLGLFHIEFMWILARGREPDQSVIDGLKKKAAGYGIDVSHFRPAVQTGCSN